MQIEEDHRAPKTSNLNFRFIANCKLQTAKCKLKKITAHPKLQTSNLN
jgi:hypothetical protein